MGLSPLYVRSPTLWLVLRRGPSGLESIQERCSVNIETKSRALLHFRHSSQTSATYRDSLPLRADNDDRFRATDRRVLRTSYEVISNAIH